MANAPSHLMASMLEPFIPRPHVLERARIPVIAEPPQVWEVMRHLDTFRSKLVRALFTLRRAPDLITGHRPAHTSHASIDDFAADSDFQLLRDVESRGFVLGAIGRFWKPHLEFHHVAPQQFSDFDGAGFAKVAWGLCVDKRRAGGSWITFELRAVTTDADSQSSFDRYWTLVAPFARAIREALFGLLREQLAPLDPENIALPGDQFVPARFSITRGIVIEALPAQVWPWLAQMGCQRAGWYAFDRLDNGGEPSAQVIHLEWQDVAPGDLIAATPDERAHFGVLQVERNRALVLGSPSLRRSGPPASEPEPFKMTWAWSIDPIGQDACWLGTRVRLNAAPTANFLLHHGWEMLLNDARQRSQLQNLKRRAEQRPVALLSQRRRGRSELNF